MITNYILGRDGVPIPTIDIMAWADWMATNRPLNQEQVGGFLVSTVFLGIDHNFSGLGPPILWETMIFAIGGGNLDYQKRYSSEKDALLGHEQAILHAKELIDGKELHSSTEEKSRH